MNVWLMVQHNNYWWLFGWPSIAMKVKIFIIIIIIIIIIIAITTLGGPLSPLANVASDLYPGHLPANFYHPVPLCLPIPRQSILISVGHILVDLQGWSTISF